MWKVIGVMKSWTNLKKCLAGTEITALIGSKEARRQGGQLPPFFNISNLTKNKTRVLSRPVICWIHYVQIAVSISAEHLSNPQKCSAMLNNTKKCLRVLKLEILTCYVSMLALHYYGILACYYFSILPF